jgi:hypothetical protein
MNILWKEWRQQRLLFALGAGLGILFPLFDLLSRRRYGVSSTHAGTAMVAVLGGLYALILAIATSQDDIRHGVSEFWQSRPVSVARVLVTKFLLGAGLLLLAFLATQGLDFLTLDPRSGDVRSAWNALTVTWPIAVLLFSVAVFLTVLMRDAARTAMVAIWVLLLIYFLPLLAGGLQWMNVFEMLWEGGRSKPSILMDVLIPAVQPYGHAAGPTIAVPVVTHMSRFEWFRHVLTLPEYVRYVAFVVVMLAGSIACLALSIAAVQRNWRWQPGQKTLAWTIGLSAALIFALAMFQVGHNLLSATNHNGQPIDPVLLRSAPAERTYDWTGESASLPRLDARQYGWPGARTCTSGNYLFAVESVSRSPSGQGLAPHDGLLDICRHPAAAENGIGKTLSRTRFASTNEVHLPARQAIELPVVSARGDRLFIAYQVSLPLAGSTGSKDLLYPFSLRMLVVDVTDPAEPKRIADVELERSRSQIRQSKGDSLYGEFCYIWGQRQLLVVSLADPEAPRIVQRISLSEFGLDENQPLAVEQVSVVGDKLLCVGPRVLLLLDRASPVAPRRVFDRIQSDTELAYTSAIRTALYAADLLYVSTDAGLEIHRLQRTTTGELQGELIGQRRMSPLERLTGRRPHELLLRQDLLYEAADRFGMLVCDVSDPTRPRRAYHAASRDSVTSIGMWQDLLYMNGSFGTLTLVAMPGTLSFEMMQ